MPSGRARPTVARLGARGPHAPTRTSRRTTPSVTARVRPPLPSATSEMVATRSRPEPAMPKMWPKVSNLCGAWTEGRDPHVDSTGGTAQRPAHGGDAHAGARRPPHAGTVGHVPGRSRHRQPGRGVVGEGAG